MCIEPARKGRMALFDTLPRHQQRLVLTALDMLLTPFARRAQLRSQQDDPDRQPNTI